MMDDVAEPLPVQIRPLVAADWRAVERIYALGMASGNATFETATPSWEEWSLGHHSFARLVAVDGGDVVGWAALSPVSRRPAYAGVAENSIYIDPARQRRGIGRTLLSALIAESEAHGIWTIQSSVFPENQATIVLHERAGFRVVGRRERIARLHGAWRDTLLLERRSGRVC